MYKIKDHILYIVRMHICILVQKLQHMHKFKCSSSKVLLCLANFTIPIQDLQFEYHHHMQFRVQIQMCLAATKRFCRSLCHIPLDRKRMNTRCSRVHNVSHRRRRRRRKHFNTPLTNLSHQMCQTEYIYICASFVNMLYMQEQCNGGLRNTHVL